MLHEAKLATNPPDLVVLTRLHLMEISPSLSRSDRIRTMNFAIEEQVLKRNNKTRIHLEFASTTDPEFTFALIHQVNYESIGMNEEEFFRESAPV